MLQPMVQEKTPDQTYTRRMPPVLNKTDFRQDFDTTHVTWEPEPYRFGKDEIDTAIVSNFRIHVKGTADGDESQHNQLGYSFLIKLVCTSPWIDIEESHSWIGLQCRNQLPYALPIIYRFIFVTEYGLIGNISGIHLFDASYPVAWRRLAEMESDHLRKFNCGIIGKMAIHLFVSIPYSNHPFDDGGRYLSGSYVCPAALYQKDEDTTEKSNGFMRQMLEQVLKDEDSGDDVDSDHFPKAEDDDSARVMYGDDSDDEPAELPSDTTLTLVKVDDESYTNYANGTTEQVVRRFFCHQAFLARGSKWFTKFFTRRRRTSSTAGRRRNQSISGFSSMFDVGTSQQQSQENDTSIRNISITIRNIDVPVMEVILRYIYLEVLPSFHEETDHDRLLKVTKAAHYFELPKLVDHCQSILIFYYSSDENRVKQYPYAEELDLYQLSAVCTEQLFMFRLGTRDRIHFEALRDGIFDVVDLKLRLRERKESKQLKVKAITAESGPGIEFGLLEELSNMKIFSPEKVLLLPKLK